jgi:hypothetical protein
MVGIGRKGSRRFGVCLEAKALGVECSIVEIALLPGAKTIVHE